MATRQLTLTIDDEVLRCVEARAARAGMPVDAVIEESLRRDLGLDVLERMRIANDLSENRAVDLAVEAQHQTRLDSD